MQQQIGDEYPSLDVAFLGVNLLGLESGNATASQGKTIPWLQDGDKDGDAVSDVWKDWGTGHLDVVILDGDNRKIGAMNAASASLDNPQNYNQLLEGLVYAATVSTPTGLDLLPGTDSGSNSTDNRTNFNNAAAGSALQVQVNGVTSGATVRLYADGVLIGETIAAGTAVTVTTTGANPLVDGSHALTATQTANGITSRLSSALTFTVDTTIAAFTSSAPPQATVNSTYFYDVQNADEGEPGFVYALSGAPSGAAINPTTGLVSWTPTAGQLGSRSFSVVATDSAGNTRTQLLTVDVGISELVRYSVEVQNLQGQTISSIDADQEFQLSVFVEDRRNSSPGVAAAYTDLTFDAGRVTLTGPLEFGPRYAVGGTSSTQTPGLIDEAGSSTAAPVGGRQLLFTAPMKATAAGLISFALDAADGSEHTTRLVGQQSAVAEQSIARGTATLQVNSVLLANNDQLSLDEDSVATTLDVLANDTAKGLGGQSPTITSVTPGSRGGQVQIASGGAAVIYTPASDIFGTETFTYTIAVGSLTDQATVTVDLRPVNDPPQVAPDSYTFNTNTGAHSLDVLANDSSEPDGGESLTIVAVGSPSQGGSVSIATDKKRLEYTPAAEFTGMETFTYTVDDGSGATRQATVTVTVRDFVPSTLSGLVYLDANGNGLADAEERRLGHVVITLAGTDSSGQRVERSITTAADGSYRFADLAPGTYTVTQRQPEFLLDGPDTVGSQGGSSAVNDQFSLELEQGVAASGYNFGERGVPARFVTYRDFLSSTPRRSFLAAAAPEEDCQWFSPSEPWSSDAAHMLRMSADGMTAVISAAGQRNEERSVNVPLTSSGAGRVVGVRNEVKLLQFSEAAMPVTTVGQSSEARATLEAGEGESSGVVSSRIPANSRSVATPETEVAVGIATAISPEVTVQGPPTGTPDARVIAVSFAPPPAAIRAPIAVPSTSRSATSIVDPVGSVAVERAVDATMESRFPAPDWRLSDDGLVLRDEGLAAYAAEVDSALTDLLASVVD